MFDRRNSIKCCVIAGEIDSKVAASSVLTRLTETKSSS